MKFKLLILFLILSIYIKSQVPFDLYGVLESTDTSFGAIFKTDSSGNNYEVLHNYEDGLHSGSNISAAGLTLASNGKFYGSGSRIIFEYDPVTNKYKKRIDLCNINLGTMGITNKMVEVAPGKLCGVVLDGGASNLGFIFEYDINTNVFTVKYSFSFYGGSNPKSSLFKANNGLVYGSTTNGGGFYSGGTIFEYNPLTGSVITKVVFSDSTGNNQINEFIEPIPGKLYANTSKWIYEYDYINDTLTRKVKIQNYGLIKGKFLKASNGQLYCIKKSGNIDSICEYNLQTNVFHGKQKLPDVTNSSLVEGINGKLYGMTNVNSLNNGIIYAYDISSNNLSTAFYFSNTANDNNGTLYNHPNGMLYGITSYYVSPNNTNYLLGGSIFHFNLSNNTVTDDVILGNKLNGASPLTAPLDYGDGFLYGVSNDGGLYGHGCLYKIDAATNDYFKLVDFPSTVSMVTDLIKGVDDKIYMYVKDGLLMNGNLSIPAIYQYNPLTNQFVAKVGITASSSIVEVNLILASNGKMYGYTNATIFEYDPILNVINTVHTLNQAINGMDFVGDFLENNGIIYGNTRSGGINSNGIIFSYNTNTGVFLKIYDYEGFSGNTGHSPTNGFCKGPNGNLYCIITNGGINNLGTIIELDIQNNQVTKRYDFTSSIAANPKSKLTLSSNGKFYSLCASTYGTIFEFDPLNNQVVKKLDIPCSDGSYNNFGYNSNTYNNLPYLKSICQGVKTNIFSLQSILCNGSNVTINSNSIGSNLSYQWFHNGSIITGNTSSSLNLLNANLLNAGSYYCSVSNGCRVSNSNTITLSYQDSTAPIILSPLTTICLGSSANLTVTGANTYTWNTGATTSNITISPTISTTYTVTGTDLNNCSSNQTVSVMVDNTCQDVWPGDANSDGTADNLDALELGLHYIQAGGSRAITSNLWQSYFSSNWTGTITNGKNVNHSDCNGDGVIDANDTLAIYTNYGLTHAFKSPEQIVANAQLSIVPDQSFVNKGTWGSASIFLGDASLPVANVNGIAFTLNFDQNLIETNSMYLEYPTSFINTGNQNLKFNKLNFASGLLYSATTHTTNTNVSGNGKIAILHYKIKSNLTTDAILNLEISQVNQSNASGVLIPLTAGAATVMAVGASVGLNELVNKHLVSVFPNPATNLITVQSNALIQKVELLNVTGQTVLSENVSAKQYQLNINEVSNGVYFISVYNVDNSIYRQKIVVQR